MPVIIFLNINSYVLYGSHILKFVLSSHTIYCEGGDGTPNSNVKTNTQSNLQSFLNTSIKNNKQITNQITPFSEEDLKFPFSLSHNRYILYGHHFYYLKYTYRR